MRLEPSDLDIASGTMLGVGAAEALPDPGVTPRGALEREILPALLRPPCLVSFSGGRDSSAVLAVATALARREGLDPPIPASNVCAGARLADEAEWQTLVVGHLGIREWLRIEHRDELDVLGPYAQRVLRRHGLLVPFNVHFHLPLLEAARGGSLLTGVGGDELFAAARRPRALLTGGLRHVPRDIARLLLSRSPRFLREATIRSRQSLELPWLRPAARRAVVGALAAQVVREPRELPQRLAWWRSLRYLRAGSCGLEQLAGDTDVKLAHPLLSAPFWAAIGRHVAGGGFEDRAHGMRSVFGDLLPDRLSTRRSKAHFDEAMWTGTARAFAHAWDGGGVPEELVDVDALRRHWKGTDVLAQSYTLLQAAWLQSAAQRVEERRDGVLV